MPSACIPIVGAKVKEGQTKACAPVNTSKMSHISKTKINLQSVEALKLKSLLSTRSPSTIFS